MPSIAPAIFSTPRLRAERIEQRHFEDLRLLDGDPEVMKTLGGLTLSPDETQEAVVRNLARWERHGYGAWVFYTGENREFVGRGALQHFDLEGTDAIEVGYAVRPPFWNQGYGRR